MTQIHNRNHDSNRNPGTNQNLVKLYSASETLKIINASRQTYYNEINSGRLQSVKRGRRRFHASNNILEYSTLLENEAAQVFDDWRQHACNHVDRRLNGEQE